jgi:hypothetical protein
MERLALDMTSNETRALRADETEDRRLADEIQRAIRRITMHGIRELGVEVVAGRIAITGECASYYTKQMAQEAAAYIRPDGRIVNQIVVAAYRPR